MYDEPNGGGNISLHGPSMRKHLRTHATEYVLNFWFPAFL